MSQRYERCDGISGDYHATGAVTIKFDAFAVGLPAPHGGKYLPCDGCDGVCEVPWDVVSFFCAHCQDDLYGDEASS